jgi:hypothetical protein
MDGAHAACCATPGVHRALSSSFTSECHWYEAVLMCQRLALAALFAFVAPSKSGVAVLVMVLVCLLFAAVRIPDWQAPRVQAAHRGWLGFDTAGGTSARSLPIVCDGLRCCGLYRRTSRGDPWPTASRRGCRRPWRCACAWWRCPVRPLPSLRKRRSSPR